MSAEVAPERVWGPHGMVKCAECGHYAFNHEAGQGCNAWHPSKPRCGCTRFHGLESAPTDEATRRSVIPQGHGGASEAIAAQVEGLVGWWAAKAKHDATVVAPKAVEYGASDLRVMGEAMLALFPGGKDRAAVVAAEQGLTADAVGVEMAIAFYLLGKAARLFGAFEQGRLPNIDTWDDAAIYSTMARRVRQVGSWPGTDVSST